MFEYRNELESGRDHASISFAFNSSLAQPDKLCFCSSFRDRSRAIIQTTFRDFLDGRVVQQLPNRAFPWRGSPHRDADDFGSRVLLPN